MRKELCDIIKENPRASLVKNKYKVLAGMVRRMFPNNYEKLPPEIWEKIIYEVVNGDREWRTLTEGKDKENKTILEANKLEELGYHITP